MSSDSEALQPLSPADLRPVRQSELIEAYNEGLTEATRTVVWQEIADSLIAKRFSIPVVVRVIALLKLMDDWRDTEKPAPPKPALAAGVRRAASASLHPTTGRFLHPADIFRS
jgi:hypothetical protein